MTLDDNQSTARLDELAGVGIPWGERDAAASFAMPDDERRAHFTFRVGLAAIVAFGCRGHSEPPSVAPRIELAMTGSAAQFGTLAHVTEVASVTRDGVTRVAIDFAPGTDADAAARDALRVAPRARVVGVRPGVVRYVIADAKLSRDQLAAIARALVAKLTAIPGVAAAIACGGAAPTVWIDLDPPRMAAGGVTADDVATALAHAGDATALQAGDAGLGGLAVAMIDNIPIQLRAIAVISRGSRPDACRASDGHGDVVVLDVSATTDVARAAAKDVLAKAALVPAPALRRVVVGLGAERFDEPDRELAALRNVAHGALVELGGDDVLDNAAIELAGSDGDIAAVASAARALPFVVGAGEPVTTIALTGDSRDAVVAAATVLAKQLASTHELIAARGIESELAMDVRVDPSSVSALGATGVDVAVATLAPDGYVAGRATVDGAELELRIRASSNQMSIHAARGLVPLDAIASQQRGTRLVEQLELGDHPAAYLYVRSDASTARAAIAAARLDAAIHVAVVNQRDST